MKIYILFYLLNCCIINIVSKQMYIIYPKIFNQNKKYIYILNLIKKKIKYFDTNYIYLIDIVYENFLIMKTVIIISYISIFYIGNLYFILINEKSSFQNKLLDWYIRWYLYLYYATLWINNLINNNLINVIY